MDTSPESLVRSPAGVAPTLSPHYWRALGHLAGRYWYEKDRSLSLLTAHLHVLVPQLDPSVQRFFLQGVGELLHDRPLYSHWVAPAELERFPHAYQEGLLEGWGMALGESGLLPYRSWGGPENPYWKAWIKGFSTRSLASIQQGKAQFEALFEGAASSAREPSHQAP